MLPWRVQVQRLLEAIRGDTALRNRVLGLLTALVLAIGASVNGFSLNIRIGDQGDGDATSAIAAAAPAGAGAATPRTAATGRPTTSARTADTAPAASADGVTDAATEGASAPTAADGATGSSAEGLSAKELPSSATTTARASTPTCEGATLTATDQGVTATTIKLGILVPNLDELQAAGFKVGLTGDFDKIMKAWTKELNENRDGIACRKVTWVKMVFDVLNVDDMIAKCKAMTEDEKVFAVVTPGGYDSVAQLCIAKDHKTPFVNPEPEPAGWYREAAPYLWNLLMSKDRTHRNHARWLVQSGQIKPGDPDAGATRVGVVYHGIPNVAPPVEDALLPELNRLGVKPVRVTKLSSDTEQALAQINQVVLQFQTANVQFVMMPMNLIFKSQFMQVAEKQNYFPRYTDSDHNFGCFDFVTTTYPAKSWQNTKCVSSAELDGYRRDDAVKFADNHPFAQYADRIYKQANPEGYTNNGQASRDQADAQRLFQIGMGSQIMLVKQAADRAGPAVTRAKWGVEMGRTGVFDQVVAPHPLTFGPEKWDGPDHLVVVEWHAEAGNGYEARKYRQIVGPFRSFY